MMLDFADCAVGGSSRASEEGFNNSYYDSILNYVSFPISSQDLSLYLPLETHAKSLRLHFWHCLVGNCTQFDCIFRRISRTYHC